MVKSIITAPLITPAVIPEPNQLVLLISNNISAINSIIPTKILNANMRIP